MSLIDVAKKVPRTLENIALYTIMTASIAASGVCLYTAAIGCGADLPVPHLVRYENDKKVIFEPVPLTKEDRLDLLGSSLGALGPATGLLALTFFWKAYNDAYRS